MDLCIQSVRDETGPDALEFMGTGRFSADDGRSVRFDCSNLDIRILRFQILTNAGNRSAGADACDKDINFTFRVSPYLCPVVLKCVSGLTGFTNCPGMMLLGRISRVPRLFL